MNMEKEFTDLGVLFQNVISDLKCSYPLWEDLIKQCGKFHSTLRLAVMGMSSFLDSLQKLGDLAMDAKGGPRDIGSSITKLCLRHKALENHLKCYTNSLMECLVVPLSEKMDEWKKNVAMLDKEHGKECKKMQVDVKKASIETMKLQKRVNKGKPDAKNKLDVCTRDYNAKASALELSERTAIVSAITEHRGRFSFLVGCIKPIVAHETAMVGELESFKDIMIILEGQTVNPFGMIEQSFTDALQGFHMTVERKKRSTKEEAEFMGTISRSSSTSSHKSGEAMLRTAHQESRPLNNHLVSSASSSSLGHNNPRSATLPQVSNAPIDGVQRSPNAIAMMTVDDNFFFKQDFVTMERTRTISPEVHPHSSNRPNLTADTFVPPPSVQQQQMLQQQTQQNQQQYYCGPSFPSTTSLSSSSSTISSNSAGVKKVEKIYARPALVKRENSVVGPVFVAPPMVPDLLGTRTKQNAKNSDTNNITSLNQVIMDLEKNAKLLESVHPSLQSLHSVQSMQCSSGYGTMTNVSSHSDETMQSIAELDALLETSLSDLEKCNTLPIKRFNHSKIESDSRRPVSTSADEVPMNIWQVRHPFNNHNDELPPPPEDFFLPPSPNQLFPPPPTNFSQPYQQNHYHQPLQQQNNYHQPQIQQKDLNLALKHRFSQLHQIPEHHNIPQPKSTVAPCPIHHHHANGENQAQDDDEPSEDSHLSSLLRGVSLRKTIVNDRSAPVLKET